MLGLNGPSKEDFSGAHFKRRNTRFALQIIGKIAAGETKVTKETHKSGIFSGNHLKITTAIVYSVASFAGVKGVHTTRLYEPIQRGDFPFSVIITASITITAF